MTTTTDLSICKDALHEFELVPIVINLRRLVQADPELTNVLSLPPAAKFFIESGEHAWGTDNELIYSSGLFSLRGVTALINRGYFSTADKQDFQARITYMTWVCVLEHNNTDADVLKTLASLVDHGILPTGNSGFSDLNEDLMVVAIDQKRSVDVCAFLFDHCVKLSEAAWNSAIDHCADCAKCMHFFLDRGFVPTPSNTWWSTPHTDGLLCANRFCKIHGVLGFPLPTLVELSTETKSLFNRNMLRFNADDIEFFEENYHISRSSMTFDDRDYVGWLMPCVD